MPTFDTSLALEINRCAARRGFHWWAESFRMLKEAPFKWCFVCIFYTAIFIILFLLGSLLGLPRPQIIAVPFFMAGIAAIGSAQARGEKKFKFSSLFAGIGKHSFRLLCIGMAMMALSIAATTLSVA
jgi:hypothetical protein